MDIIQMHMTQMSWMLCAAYGKQHSSQNTWVGSEVRVKF